MRDKVGFGSGIGNCAKYDAYLLTSPSREALDQARKALGGKALYPDVERRCSKFDVKVKGASHGN